MNGKTVRNIRLYNGLTQAEFSEKIGVSPGTIAAIEGGHRQVNDKIRMKVAQFCEIDGNFLDVVKRMDDLDDIASSG